MCSPASFDTAYVQRASPTEPIVDTCPSLTLYACVPKTSLVEKSTKRSSVRSVASAASSTLYVPITLTRIVRTGLSSTVSTPAIAAQWTRWVAPAASSRTSSASSTSPCWKMKFGWSVSSVPESASRCRLSIATISLRSTSSRASVVAMKPAPPVITIRLPSSMPPKPTCAPLEPDPVAPAARCQRDHGFRGLARDVVRGGNAEAVAQPVRLRPDEQRLERGVERRERLVDPAVERGIAGRLPDEHERATARAHLELEVDAALEPAVPLVHDVEGEPVAPGVVGRLDRNRHKGRRARSECMRERRAEGGGKPAVGEADLGQAAGPVRPRLRAEVRHADVQRAHLAGDVRLEQ